MSYLTASYGSLEKEAEARYGPPLYMTDQKCFHFWEGLYLAAHEPLQKDLGVEEFFNFILPDIESERVAVRIRRRLKLIVAFWKQAELF